MSSALKSSRRPMSIFAQITAATTHRSVSVNRQTRAQGLALVASVLCAACSTPTGYRLEPSAPVTSRGEGKPIALRTVQPLEFTLR